MANSPDPRDDETPEKGADGGGSAGQRRPDQGGAPAGKQEADPATGGEGAAGAGGSGGFGT
ncbi:hypothetical protein [Brevundimonas sp.]|uniref:hypothetical protein n=1 Tax=Brevundimonas sp. TaxID=1871086 RepID=UPI002D44AFA9|nr:hypothetical protein [Brevundimonas sp.]HYC68283.1 hypothetical protein [Brevundimonas sp.]